MQMALHRQCISKKKSLPDSRLLSRTLKLTCTWRKQGDALNKKITFKKL